MIGKTLNYLSHHAIALLALICSLLALAGASYAAISIPNNSVGTAQLKQGAVTSGKLSSKQFGGYVRMYAKINSAGQLVYAYPKAKLIGWRLTGTFNGGTIAWKPPTSNRCVALSTGQGGANIASTNAAIQGGPGGPFHTQVFVQMSSPAGVVVAVVC